MSTDLPPPQRLHEISSIQEEREREAQHTRAQHTPAEHEAAQLIQRNYRGYRARRELKGYSLSSSERWTEAVRDAQYRHSTRPLPSHGGPPPLSTQVSPTDGNAAQGRWRIAKTVAQRATHDSATDTDVEPSMSPEEQQAYKQKKRNEKAGRQSNAKVMGLEYFLEMVDQKHRYGSSLRAYHRVWQQSETKENFFYWLDYGEGKDFELEERPRKRLDEELVRYLSKEERKKYLVYVDEAGLLCWAKNGERITTSPEYRDSMDGIVSVSDTTTRTWRDTTGQQTVASSSDDSDSASDISVGSNEDAARYTNQELHNAKGLTKIKHVSTNTLMNSLLRKTTKKNTWIFVVDTSFRMYIGIKQSGAFQHSSFLHGGRVSAAGLIRIKRGQLRRLSPLSGHYAPPVKNFRQFVHNLKEDGADMSRVSISRSYAVLVGLDSYLGVKRGVKKGEQRVKDILNPQEAKKREEQQRDMSSSAQKERAFLEAQAKAQRKQSLTGRMMKRLSLDDKEKNGLPPPADTGQ